MLDSKPGSKLLIIYFLMSDARLKFAGLIQQWERDVSLHEPWTSSSPLTPGRLFKIQACSQNKQNNLYRSPDPDQKSYILA